jgi:hypothetical protein
MITTTIGISALLSLLFAHTVADFVFQTDKMAINKSKSNSWLLFHTISYTVWLLILLCICNFPIYVLSGTSILPKAFSVMLSFLVANFVAHTATDYVTSRMTSYLWKKERRHEFFVVIGFDQFIHIATLVLTYCWLIL